MSSRERNRGSGIERKKTKNIGTGKEKKTMFVGRKQKMGKVVRKRTRWRNLKRKAEEFCSTVLTGKSCDYDCARV